MSQYGNCFKTQKFQITDNNNINVRLRQPLRHMHYISQSYVSVAAVMSGRVTSDVEAKPGM